MRLVLGGKLEEVESLESVELSKSVKYKHI